MPVTRIQLIHWKAPEAVERSLRTAIAHPPSSPVVPQSQFDAYAGKPLVEKLGIKPHSTVGLTSAQELDRLLRRAVACRPLLALASLSPRRLDP